MPLIAVFEQIKNLPSSQNIAVKCFFIGNAGDFKEELGKNGFILLKMRVPKWRRYGSMRNLIDLLLAPVSIIQAAWQLWLVMPDVVFSKGGGGTAILVFFAWLFRIPALIHESDAVPGKSNLAASRFASYVAVSFPRSQEKLPKGKTFLIGQPIRQAIFSGSKDDGFRITGFDSNLPFVFVWGGSQGAEIINESILNVLPTLLPKMQILHQCGIKNFERIKKESEFMLRGVPEAGRKNYRVEAFVNLDNLPHVLAACGLVVARAGANTIFELAAAAKPAILIPLPHAAQDHQRLNAYDYAQEGGGEVMEQQNLSAHLLAERITLLIEDAERRAKMVEAAKKFSRPDAAKEIGEELLRLAGFK